MRNRFGLAAVLSVGLVLPFLGCSSNGLDSIQVTPNAETWTLCGAGATGAPVQFTAIGTYNHGAHPATTKNLTDVATWASSVPAIATVSSTGVGQVTPLNNGYSGDTLITATMEGFGGPITGTATMTKVTQATCSSSSMAPRTPSAGQKL
jgi:hypothetical protein